jgi:hypothetical protein
MESPNANSYVEIGVSSEFAALVRTHKGTRAPAPHFNTCRYIQ